MSSSIEPFDVAAHFDQRIALEYARRIRRFCPSYDSLHEMTAEILRALPEGATLLSAGAGTGEEILTLGKRYPSWRFVAVDASADMLAACRQRACMAQMEDRVSFFCGPMEGYRPHDAADAASSIFVAHFIKGRTEKIDYFRALAANVKAGGVLVVADLYGDERTPEFTWLFELWMSSCASHGISGEELRRDRNHVERDVDFIPENELFSILDEAGFVNPVRFYQTYLFGGWIATRAPIGQ